MQLFLYWWVKELLRVILFALGVVCAYGFPVNQVVIITVILILVSPIFAYFDVKDGDE